MNKKILISLLTITALILGSTVFAKNDKRANDLIWANDLLYDTVFPGAEFKGGPEHSFDILYMFDESLGLQPVSDAAPGDRNYNGGRWWVHMVELTDLGCLMHDNGDMMITSADELLECEQMGYVVIHPTETFFSCPLVGKGKPMEY